MAKNVFTCIICGINWKEHHYGQEGICQTCMKYKLMHQRMYGKDAPGAVRYVRACTQTEGYYRQHCLAGYTVRDWQQWQSWLADDAQSETKEHERIAV